MWTDDLLAAMGAPNSGANRNALDLWAQSEGMPAWENNWLATTEPGYGGTIVNGAGVMAYPTEAAGVAATWATLQFGAYRAIVAAFRNNAGYGEIWRAVNGSPWCSGCQGGKYPVALYDNLNTPPPPGEGFGVTGTGPNLPNAPDVHAAWDQLSSWMGEGAGWQAAAAAFSGAAIATGQHQ